MPLTSKTLQLPPRQTELLHAALGLLHGCVPVDVCVLGGGTALAARWGHRTSLDIDLFTTERTFRGAVNELAGRVAEWQASGRLASARMHPTVVHCITPQGDEFSLGGSDDITTSAIPLDECEVTTGTRLQSTSEILARKVRARMVNLRQYVVRDAYDVVACLLHDPDSLDHALASLDPLDHAHLDYDSTRSSLVLDDRKPLIDAAYEGLCDSEDLKTAMFAALTGDAAGRGGVRNQLAKRLANRPRGVGR